MFKTLEEWSKAVKQRDKKCMECGVTSGLHAHHVLPKSTHPELKLALENGRTLCYVCHKRWHETNRAPRIRSEYKPQRKTLMARLEWLEEEWQRLSAQNKQLTSQVNKCKSGKCHAALYRYGQLRQYAGPYAVLGEVPQCNN